MEKAEAPVHTRQAYAHPHPRPPGAGAWTGRTFQETGGKWPRTRTRTISIGKMAKEGILGSETWRIVGEKVQEDKRASVCWE